MRRRRLLPAATLGSAGLRLTGQGQVEVNLQIGRSPQESIINKGAVAPLSKDSKEPPHWPANLRQRGLQGKQVGATGLRLS